MTDLKLAAQKALEAMTRLEGYAARNVCAHDETKRGGAIWEICCMCGAKWADDEGGKPPYEDPPEMIAAAEAIDALRSALQHQEEQEPTTIAVPIEAYRWLMGCGNDAFMPDRDGAFWWRGKFNDLAGLDVRDYMGLATPPLLQKEEGAKLWLWKNFVDGRPEYWAFDNPYPINLTDGDPQTLGEPCGYALFKPSRVGRTDRTEEQVLLAIKRARP